MSGISLEGRSVIVAMCVGQLGSLLPHVVVPSILAAFLIPEWHLSGAQAGLLAGSGAAGYMLRRAGAGNADRPYRRAQNSDRGIRAQRARHLAVRPLCHEPLVGRVLQRDRGRRLCRSLHARAQGADRPPCAGRFIPRDHAVHVELFVRRRPVVSGLATGRGRLGLADRIPGDRLWSAGDADRLLAVAAGRTKAAQGRLLDFAPVFRNTRAMGFVLGYGAHCFELYGIRTWLVAFWTFVAMKNPDSLDLDACRRQRAVLRARDARQHSRQRIRAPDRPASRHHGRDVQLRRGGAADRAVRRQVAVVPAAADAGLCDHGAGRLRRADIGHGDGGNPDYRGATMATHSTVGFSLSALGAWVVGVALDAAGGPLDPIRLDGGVLGAGGGYSAWSGGALLVQKNDALSHEPAPASHHPGARHHADAGLGVELLSAGDPGRSDRARSRRLLELDLCRLLGVAGDLGAARPAHRPADRSGRRPVGAVDVQSDAGRGTGAARLHHFDPGACARLAPARRRHGRRPVRCGLRRARAHLWRRGAPLDHRHHADRGFCLDRRMAADGLGAGNHRLAQHLLCLGGGAYPDRPADQFVHAARR